MHQNLHTPLAHENPAYCSQVNEPKTAKKVVMDVSNVPDTPRRPSEQPFPPPPPPKP